MHINFESRHKHLLEAAIESERFKDLFSCSGLDFNIENSEGMDNEVEFHLICQNRIADVSYEHHAMDIAEAFLNGYIEGSMNRWSS